MSTVIDWRQVCAARERGEDTLAALQHQLGLEAQPTLQRAAHGLDMVAWESAALMQATPAFGTWPLALAQATQAVLVRGPTGEGLHAVLGDPLDEALIARLLHQAGDETVTLGVAWPQDLQALLNRHGTQASATGQLPALAQRGAAEVPADTLALETPHEHDHPAVRLVNATLIDALRAGASDVHLECTPSGLAVKLRIDGMLDALTAVDDAALAEQAISRLKVLAELDIGERRVPQDGSFRVQWQGRGIDLRLSVIPGVHGEDAVIRILDKRDMAQTQGPLSLRGLGFDVATVASLHQAAQAAHGMVLVTGPTGSGKTTTLYALLGDTRSGREKVITIEDPVEYQLDGVLQIPVNERKGLSFARGLRSVLRHDPDTIMVGEIRDRETAEIAVQSALTGHLVLTTVHANSVFDVFDRFTHMGLDAHALASALNGVWAQRLLRRVCPDCGQDAPPAPGEWEALAGCAPPAGAHILRGAGCGNCRGTGYKGRQAIAEVLVLDDELRELVVQRAPVRQLKALARSRGARSLREAALALASRGHTTLEEVRRVTVAS
jgi:general secretion pathway protein E